MASKINEALLKDEKNKKGRETDLLGKVAGLFGHQLREQRLGVPHLRSRFSRERKIQT